MKIQSQSIQYLPTVRSLNKQTPEPAEQHAAAKETRPIQALRRTLSTSPQEERAHKLPLHLTYSQQAAVNSYRDQQVFIEQANLHQVMGVDLYV